MAERPKFSESIRLNPGGCKLLPMNNEDAHTPTMIDQLIATLLAFFGVPVAFALRVLSRSVIVRARFADLLQVFKRKRWALRYEGESDETVQARIALLEWFAEDPRRACKHLARQVRGWNAYRWMRFGNVPRPVVRVMGDVLVDACGFESPLPDTS